MSKTIELNEEVSVTWDKNYVYINYTEGTGSIKIGRIKELVEKIKNTKKDSFDTFLRKNGITTKFKEEWRKSSWRARDDMKGFPYFRWTYIPNDYVCDAFHWQSTADGFRYWEDIDTEWEIYSEVEHIVGYGVKFEGDNVWVGCQCVEKDTIIGLLKSIEMSKKS
jgi:hypothetical protein